MRILIVGAGATGTVLGSALSRGGAEVSFHVRPHHRARIAEGLTLHRQELFTRSTQRLEGAGITTNTTEVAATPWEQVWFTTPSDALREAWLDEFLPATGSATLVALQPDPEDIQYLRDHGGRDHRIIQGLIQFSAWQSPLPHEPRDLDGVTCLLPPGSAMLFDAEYPDSETIVAMLRRGGLRASVRKNLPAHAARLAATLQPLIAGLELAGWSLERFSRHELLDLAVQASHEAVRAECARFSTTEPWSSRLLLNRVTAFAALRALPWIPGWNAEAFLAYHFSKVDRQTRMMLATYQRHARLHALPHEALDTLIGALPPPGH